MKNLRSLFILTVTLFAVALPGLSWGTDCTVTLGTDTGSAGELRDCINNVATTDGDVVTISPNLTVNLTAGEINIPNSIWIQGAGDGTSIVDGSGNGGARTFHISPTNADKGVRITGVTLQGANATVEGGAIYIDYEGALYLENCAIVDNDSTESGAGVYVSGSLVVDHCSFSLNDSGNYGGAIYNDANLEVANSSTFDQNTAVYGGGIYNTGAADVRSVTMTNNQATSGDGGAINTDTTFRLSDCQITGNTAPSNSGGGIYNSSELLVVENCEIGGNTANTYGGGIYNGDNLIVINSHLHDNTSTLEQGGAIYNSESVTVEDSEIGPNNKSNDDGGGIYSSYTGFITRTYIHDNETTNGDGGGVYNGDYLAIESSRFENNKANGDGGGISNGCCEMILTNSSVTGNTAGNDAGGIFNSSDHMVIVNSTVSGNTAENDGGGIFTEGNLVINNSTIADNNANTGMGGGIFNDDQTTLTNTILANNAAGASDPDCYNLNTTLLASGGNSLIETVSANCILSGETATDVPPGTDPELSAAADNGGPWIGTSSNPVRTLTMALASTSPAIDAGNNDTCEDTDQRGVVRPQGVNCDIGALEAGPTADLSTTNLVFPETSVGTTSDPMVATLTNNGSIALEINSITVTGLDAGDFAQTNDCGNSLAVGATCNITVTFTPTLNGVRQASITVDTSANVQLITLLGAGINGGAFVGGGGCSFHAGITLSPKTYGPLAILSAISLFGFLALRRRRA